MNGHKSLRRIQVVHLSPSLDQGGLEKLQIEFARHADRDRFDLHFVALQHGGMTVDELRKLGWPVEVLDKPAGLRPLKILDLAHRFRRNHIDILHTHNNGPLIYGAPAARLARLSVVIHTRHHGRDHEVNHREVALSSAATRLTDQVVCVSEDSLTQGRLDGIAPKRLKTIWNGIDIERFAYQGPNPSGPVVTVARLQPEKNIESLLQATALIVREEPDFQVEIAGDGRLLDSLKALAKELQIENHVRFLGNINDVPALLSRASMMVLPSLTEGISLTLLEAMARGLPVVATKVGGNPEVVVDGETGLLVPSANPPALAQALLRLHRNPGEARLMGISGRRRIEQYFDVRRMVLDYESLYEKYLGGFPRKKNLPPVISLESRIVQGDSSHVENCDAHSCHEASTA